MMLVRCDRNISRRRLFGTVLCAVLAVSSLASDAVERDAPFAHTGSGMGDDEAAPDLPFTLTVSSPKTTLLPNEPLALDWRITYAGEESVWILEPNVDVHITEPDGDGYDVRPLEFFDDFSEKIALVEPGASLKGGKLLEYVGRSQGPGAGIPFTRTGVYEVMCAYLPCVTDPENTADAHCGRLVRSNVLEVKVVAAQGRDRDASALFGDVLRGGRSRDPAVRERARKARERLATEFGDTVFGLYQRMIWVAGEAHRSVLEASRAPIPEMGQRIAQAQQSRVEMFEAFVRDADAADFPLLSSAMVQLTQAYLSAHMEAEAQEICDAMRERFPDSRHTEYVERLLRGEEDPPVP